MIKQQRQQQRKQRIQFVPTLSLLLLKIMVVTFASAFVVSQNHVRSSTRIRLRVPSQSYYHSKRATFTSTSTSITTSTTSTSTTIRSLNGQGKRPDHRNHSHHHSSIPLEEPSTFPEWAYESREFFHYELIYQSKKSNARVGKIHTPHGIIDTPGYVAVATNGALKGVDMRDADDAGQQLVFCNSYHLLLQPGPDIIQGAGGLHKFMNRNKPLITDSGGFQVFSLAYGTVQESLESEGELKRSASARKPRSSSSADDNSATTTTTNTHDSKNGGGGRNSQSPVKVTEDGVHFKSYRDGRKIFLTPESTVEAQKSYGADIIIPLDQLPPYHIDHQKLVESVERSHRWEARSLRTHLKNVKNQAMYCVVHGGVDVELRTKSVNYLTSLPFDGYAIGGSLGKHSDELIDLLTWMMPMFEEGHRKNKPRHLLGIADEKSILGSVKHGIDTFDSCYPTRLSRHGTLLTRKGKLYIKSGKHSKSYGIPIDPECSCKTCQHYDRAYLWHLFKANEPVFMQLGTLHNIQYMNDLMKQQRQSILDGEI